MDEEQLSEAWIHESAKSIALENSQIDVLLADFCIAYCPMFSLERRRWMTQLKCEVRKLNEPSLVRNPNEEPDVAAPIYNRSTPVVRWEAEIGELP